MKSKVVFINHPYYAVNHPSNNLKIYKKHKNGNWYYIKCTDKEQYRHELKKYICGFYDYSRDEKKAKSSMFDYFMGGKKSETVMARNKMRREKMAMLKDGSFIKDDMVDNLQKKWSKLLEDSNVNLAVLSLNQNYVDENILIDDLQKEITTKIMPKFLKYAGYQDPEKKLEWIVSLHCDRENNYHFHIAWIEKNKCYKLKNNRLGHRYKLKLTENENNFMKRQVSLSIERNKLYKPALIKINEKLENLQSYFNPKTKNFILKNIADLDLEEDIVKLGYLLKKIRTNEKKYIKYNSLPKNEIGKEIRTITNEIKNKLFDYKDELKFSKSEINKSINKLNDIFLDIDKRNNISNVGFENAFDNKMIQKKLEKTNNYILNAIVNNALYNYQYNKDNTKKKKISLEDLIGEIAITIYNNTLYFNDKKKFRLKVLENYFIYGKYQNHDKLSNALRRLSKDSEDAAKQFYEMFEENEYDKNI